MPTTPGRPPLTCAQLEKRKAKKTTKQGTIKVLKKCDSRNDHVYRPCNTTIKGKCVSSDKCDDANSAIMDRKKKQYRADTTKACNLMKKNTGLPCRVTRKYPPTCRNLKNDKPKPKPKPKTLGLF
jgi:hypothetical protein